MLNNSSVFFYFAAAVVLVAVKLLLEHQRTTDRKNGCEDAPEMYTMKGMLRAIRTERWQKKMARKEAKRLNRTELSRADTSETPVSVRKFVSLEKQKETSEKAFNKSSSE